MAEQTQGPGVTFMHKISTQVVCFSGNHPWTPNTVRQNLLKEHSTAEAIFWVLSHLLGNTRALL